MRRLKICVFPFIVEILLNLIVISPGVNATECTPTPFPSKDQDTFASTAAVRIQNGSGTVNIEILLGDLLLTGSNTTIARSDHFLQGSEPDVDGAMVGSSGQWTVADSDIPTPFPTPFHGPFLTVATPTPSPPREVHTEIVSLDLVGTITTFTNSSNILLPGTNTSVRLRAGREQFAIFPTPTEFQRRSLGEVESKSSTDDPMNGFPARSFFAVFFVVDIGNPPMLRLFNKHQFVLECEDICEFPPICKYIHTLGEGTSGEFAVELFNVANPDAGTGTGFFITSAVHGARVAVGIGDLPPDKPTVITLLYFKVMAGANGSVNLTWETATEIDNAGFNLYRAKTKDGRYKKINDTLIPAQGSAVSGTSYSYVDTPGKKGTFYYKLEDIDYYGVSTMHGPEKVRVRSGNNAARR